MAQPKLAAKPGKPASAGRPRNFDSKEVLDQALELFWKNGFANTTTRELETGLALNQSSIYNSFGSKEQFFTLVLDRYESITGRALLQPLEVPDAGIVAIETYFTDLFDWITRDGRRGCMLINLMAEDGGRNAAFAARVEGYRQRVNSALCKALETAASCGDISPGDNRARALVLIGLILGLNIAARACSVRTEPDQLSQAIHAQIQSWRVQRRADAESSV